MATLVIVDDNRDFRQLLRDYFAESAPHLEVVGEAANGDEAVLVATRSQPDAVILDWQMPVVDGLAALPRLRSVAPDAFIVVYSSLGRAAADEALEAGAHAYVAKQEGLLALVARLESLLRRPRPPRPRRA